MYPAVLRVLLSVLVLSCVAGGLDAVPLATLTIRYNGTLPKVEVLVNMVKRGEIAPGQTISVQLPANASYTVTLRRNDLAETKTAWLASGLTRQLVFFGPNALAEEEATTGSITVQLSGRYDWANAFLNERPLGRVVRGQAKVLHVKSGETYKITVRREGHESSLTVYVGVGGDLSKKAVHLRL